MQRQASRELTIDAVVLGLVLAVVMGAANVYMGLKAGMTVSASIPAAVIGMGLLRGVLRRGSIDSTARKGGDLGYLGDDFGILHCWAQG